MIGIDKEKLAEGGMIYNSDYDVYLDADGNVVDNLEIDGETYHSSIDNDFYKELIAEKEKAVESGFIYDSHSMDDEQTQLNKYTLQNKIKDFTNNPLNTHLEPDTDVDNAYQDIKDDEGYEADTLEGHINYTHDELNDPNINAMLEFSPENLNVYKDANKFIKEVEEEGTYRSNVKDAKAGLEGLSEYNNNIFDEIGYDILAQAANAISYLIPASAGIEDKETKDKYQLALNIRNKAIKPAVAGKVVELKQLYEDKYKDVSPYGDREDSELTLYTQKKLEGEIRRLEAFLDGQIAYNPLNKEDITHYASTGIIQAIEASSIYGDLIRKMNDENYTLTDEEKMNAQALGLITSTKGLNIEQKWLYNLTEGLNHSMEFFADNLAGMRMGAEASKKVIDKLGTKFLARTAARSADLGTQLLLHSGTYTTAFDKYNGDILIDEEGNVTTDRRQYETLVKELDNDYNKYEESLETASADQAPIIRELMKQNIEAKNKLVEPPSAFDASVYGVTQNLAEFYSETYLFKDLGRGLKMSKSTGNFLLGGEKNARKVLRKIKNNRVSKALEKANNFGLKQRRFYNKAVGIAGDNSKRLGSWGEEMGEEVFTQLLPDYMNTKEQNAAKRRELLTANWWTNTAATTFLVGQFMEKGGRALNILTRDKSVRDKRKELEELYKQLESSGLKQEDFNELMMKAGEGKFSVQEYNNTINDLLEKGDIDGADKVERNKFYNMGLEAIKVGKLDKFKKSIKSTLKNPKLNARTIANLQHTLREIKSLEKDFNSSYELLNQEDVLPLHKQKRQLNQVLSELHKKKDTYKKEADLKLVDDATQLIEKQLSEVDSEIEKLTAPELQRKLRLENKLTQNTYKKYKGIEFKTNKEFEKFKEHLKKDIADNNKYKLKKKSLKKVYSEVMMQIATDSTIKAAREAEKEARKKAKEDAKKDIKDAADEIVNTATDEVVEDTKPPPAKTNVVKDDNTKVVDKEGDVIKEVKDDAPKKSNPFLKAKTREEVEAVTNSFNMSDLLQDELKGDGKIDTSEGDAFAEEMFGEPLLPGVDGSFVKEVFDDLVKSFKTISNILKVKNGTQPTFDDMITYFVHSLDLTVEDLQPHFKSFGLAYDALGIGKSNWESLYDDLYNTNKEDIRKMLGFTNKPVTTTEVTNEERIEQIKEEQEVVGEEAHNQDKVIDPTTDSPVVILTPNYKKTIGTEYKLHYKAVEYEEVETVDQDGETVTEKKSGVIPKSNTKDKGWQHIANPNKNNEGDKLRPEMVDPKEWDKTIVTDRDEFGKKLDEITFVEWLDKYIPNHNNMSVEELSKLDEFIAKVPITYIDSEEEKTIHVTDVDWYNAYSVIDVSLRSGEKLDPKNPSETHKKDIEENQRKAMELRRQILTGKVKEVEIYDNENAFPLEIFELDEDGNVIPPKSLEEISPDAQIVWMDDSGRLRDLDNNIIEEDDIVNYGDEEKGFARRREEEIDGDKVEVPVNRNKTHYLVHIRTTKDGVKKYYAVNAFRRNEDNVDGAFKEDIETARQIAAARIILKKKGKKLDESHPLYMTEDAAKSLVEDFEKQTGINILTNGNDVIEAMLAYNDVNGKIVRGKDVAAKLTKVDKNNKLVFDERYFTQNTSLTFKNKPIASIKKGKNGLEVSKVAKDYDSYLKKRLQTNVMAFEVGKDSKGNKITTIAPQQVIIIKPIVNEEVNDTKGVLKEKKEEPTADINKQIAEIEKKRKRELREIFVEDLSPSKIKALFKRFNAGVVTVIRVENTFDIIINKKRYNVSNYNEIVSLIKKINPDSVNINAFGKLEDEKNTGVVFEVESAQSIKNKINAKYDAQIEALKNNTETEVIEKKPLTQEEIINTMLSEKMQKYLKKLRKSYPTIEVKFTQEDGVSFEVGGVTIYNQKKSDSNVYEKYGISETEWNALTVEEQNRIKECN